MRDPREGHETQAPFSSDAAAQARAARQRQALLRLTGPDTVRSDDFEATLREVARIDAQTLGVERVSVWLFDEARTVLRRQTLWELSPQRASGGIELRTADYPSYFAALDTSEVIAADDVQHDPRTLEFTECYLRPIGITSMMDAPIHVEGRLRGVVCHEHVGAPRAWAEDEQTFAVAVAGIVALAMSLEGRRQAEAALRESQERFRELAEHIEEVFWLRDLRSGRLLYLSPAFDVVWGRPREALLDRPELWIEAVCAEDRPRAAALVKPQSTAACGEAVEYRIIRPDGQVRWIQDRAFPVPDQAGRPYRLAGVAEDITERRRLEAQIRQGQKMEAVGRLAGGVAHDFNNLLTAILGYADVLSTRLQGQASVLSELAEIRTSAERAASLTQQLLTFSRQQTIVPRLLSLNTVVHALQDLLRKVVGEEVELSMDLLPTLGYVRADPDQIDQLLLSLAANARDAMPGGGRLTLVTREADLDDAFAVQHLGAPRGPHVMLRVADTGVGMTKDSLARLFEPFYTSKELGHGNGLGLATVYGIVKQNNGYIHVQSEPGQGAAFEIYLPRVAAGMAFPADPAPGTPPRSGRRVLLAEDEPVVRRLVSATLKHAGYAVAAAANGEEALRLFKAGPGLFDILLTDLVMPGMGGRELAAHLKRLSPGFPVLYMSGYTPEASFREGGLEPGDAYLPKPFTPGELLQKLRRVLSGIRS